MRMQLNDKVIIITGGCQGLGRSMAEYFAGKGARLALVDLNQEKLDDAVAACKAKGVEARSLAVQKPVVTWRSPYSSASTGAASENWSMLSEA